MVLGVLVALKKGVLVFHVYKIDVIFDVCQGEFELSKNLKATLDGWLIVVLYNFKKYTPKRIRTSDPQLRRLLLYPTELLAQAMVVGARGLEPPISCSQSKRLSH